ncbi:putative phosphoribosyltransferase [Thermovibrio guaymasensis]|uniref:Putative phosphoribosyltransferase n=1 Tax=Thermovibrio guaymasensis TaxID=240167 RepID=A0A420W660_9BACT|nr:phosphoribosyltransferase family protein [Thermovibrio guaymasensis]RKQ60633.1 putative phosphoribosyltransferase [Thermovibrio guaymasensis]
MAIFKDRLEAGYRLAERLKLPSNSVIFAIPRGGVPVGYALSKAFKVPFDIVVVRKLPIPWNPEAGFGAITLDGRVVLNPEFEGYLSPKTVEEIARVVHQEVLRRNEVYRGGKGYRDLKGKVAVVVDDGFASGYTAIAAANFLKKFSPDAVVAVAPVCPVHTKELLEDHFDQVYCLVESRELPFAVASFYYDFHDLSDQEVLNFVEDLRKEGLFFPEVEGENS